MIKKRRGNHYPRLSIALEMLLKSKKEITVAGLASEISEWALERGKSDRDLADGLRGSLTRLSRGDRIMPNTAQLIDDYFQDYQFEFLPNNALEESLLDLDRFFFRRGDIIDEIGPKLEGSFQTYAKSTSININLCRRGLIEFKYDKSKKLITIHENQHRPKHDQFDEVKLNWEGYCTKVHETIVAVMRTTEYAFNTTPLFYIFWDIKTDAQGKIKSMCANSIGIDPESHWPTFPIIHVERSKSPVVDFIEPDNIPLYIRSIIRV